MAKQLFAGKFDIIAYHHYPPLYPLIISPAFFWGEYRSLTSISFINSVISSTSIFPIYLLARNFFSRKFSFFFTVVGALFPFHLIYPGLVLSENLAYPLFFWSIFLVFYNPKWKRFAWIWYILQGVVIGLSCLTRYQSFALIPIFLFVIWMHPSDDEMGLNIYPTRGKIKKIILVLLAIILTYLPWGMAGLLNGLSFKQILGLQIYGGRLIPRNGTIIDLLYWAGLSFAYFVLLAGPVIPVLFQAASKIRSFAINRKTLLWLILIGGISFSLYATITNHAWRAVYNYPEPTRLVGRYAIYLSSLIWMTALGLYRDMKYRNTIKLIVFSLISFICFGLSYLIFNAPGWIFEKSMIFFFYIDGYLPSVEPASFFIFLIFSATLSIYFLVSRQNKIGSIVILGFLAMTFIWSYQGFLRKFEEWTLPGRHTDALLDVIRSNTTKTSNFDELVWFIEDDEFLLNEEMIVRGLNQETLRIRYLNGNHNSDIGCIIRMMAKYPDGSAYAVVDLGRPCKVSEQYWRNRYDSAGSSFAVIQVPVND